MEQQVNDELTEAQFLPADHPLLAKMQATLTKQLEEELDRLTMDFIQKSKAFEALEKRKEQVGIHLYESQQKIVELQQEGEKKQLRYQEVKEETAAKRQSLQSLESTLQLKLKEAEDLERQLAARMTELSAQNIALKEIESYNEELKSDIKVKRRVTYKVEENIVEGEHLKNRQDVLINSLYEEEKRIREQLSVIEERKQSQAEQASAARGMLLKGQEEIEKVHASKKTLLAHLHRTTMELEEKHSVLESMTEELDKTREEELRRMSEVSALEAKLKFENSQNALLTASLEKQRKEERHLEAVQLKVEEKIKKVKGKSELLNAAGTAAEAEVKVLEREAEAVRTRMHQIEENIMKFHTEIKIKSEGLVKLVSEHKSIEKLQKNTLKRMAELDVARKEKEIEVETLENEIARVRLDILNTENDITGLQERRGSLQREQEEGDKTIAKYESLVKSNHDAHEKKMHEIAKFNREHDKAQKAGDLHSRGPSEATLAQLKTETQEMRRERKRLEGEFIKLQTLAVEREIQCQALSERISGLKCRETVLSQKNMRLNASYAVHLKEIKTLQASLKRYEQDMNKLNDFLALFGQRAGALKNENLNINSEFVEKLKALETASAKLEVEVDRLREGKAELLQEVTECERQIMLWERKIQLEREMQETLDPNVGQQEIQALRKDLHLKELRLAEIKKEQDQLVVEIDRVVQKRDIIQIKYNQKESQQFSDETELLKARKTGGPSNSQVAKNIELLKTSIAQSQKNITNFERQTLKLEKENINISNSTEATQQQITGIEDELRSLNLSIQKHKVQKLLNVLKIHTAQQKALCFERVLKAGKVTKAAVGVESAIKTQQEKGKAIVDGLKRVVEEQSELVYVGPVLREMEEFVLKETSNYK